MLPFETDGNRVEHIDGMSVEFPYCMHERDLTDFVVPWHWHEELELGYIEKGTSLIRTLEQEYIVHQGDGFFINTNVVDTKRNGNPGKPSLEINHIFHPVFIGGHFGSRITAKYLKPVLQNQQISVHVLRRGSREADAVLENLIVLKALNGKQNQEIAIRNILSETWLLLLDEINRHFIEPKAADSEKQGQIKAMLAHIHAHFDEKITLEGIAKSANISTRETNRVFRKSISQTPFEYLMSYRLEKAREMLKETELSITEIGAMCGFSDSTYFGKQFRKVYRISPSDYRRN